MKTCPIMPFFAKAIEARLKAELARPVDREPQSPEMKRAVARWKEGRR